MEQKEQVYQLLEKRKGTLTRKEALNASINPNTLKRMLDAGEVYSPISGILVQEDRLEDTYYSRQQVFTRGIYSLESALVLHDLTDLIPKYYVMTFPRGYRNPNLSKYHIKGIYKPMEIYELGIEKMLSAQGNPIKVYNLERTLCDVWNPRNKMDVALKTQAAKAYVKPPRRKQFLLPSYLKKLNLSTELIQVLEMLK